MTADLLLRLGAPPLDSRQHALYWRPSDHPGCVSEQMTFSTDVDALSQSKVAARARVRFELSMTPTVVRIFCYLRLCHRSWITKVDYVALPRLITHVRFGSLADA